MQHAFILSTKTSNSDFARKLFQNQKMTNIPLTQKNKKSKKIVEK